VGVVKDVVDAFEGLIDALARRRDADAAAELYATDGDVTFWGSTVDEIAIGPKAVASLLHEITESPTQLTPTWEPHRVHVEGDVAWVNAVGELRVENPGQEPRLAPYRITAVLVRRNGAWRWHTFSGSEPDRRGDG
jgi:ketosteroid isomerase-like protein